MVAKRHRVLVIGPLSKTGGVATHTNALVNLFKADENIRLLTYNISPESKIKPLQDVKKVLKRKVLLKMYLKKHRDDFDIIHTQTSGGMPSFWSAQSVASIKKEIGKLFVMTFHHGDIKNFISKNKKQFGKVLTELDHLILVSEFQRKSVTQEFPWFERISIIPNGFDGKIFKPKHSSRSRKKLKLANDAKVFLNIGNLVKVKGQRYLIDAMKAVIKKHNNAKLFIIGNGSIKNDLEKQIQNNALENHIQLIPGNKSNQELAEWMNACDVFVFPSIEESFGTVQVEAMACGKPVVATYNGGSEEIITDKKLGILVKPKNPTVLANAMVNAINNEWDEKYILNYVKKFEWKNIAEQNIRIYYQILEQD